MAMLSKELSKRVGALVRQCHPLLENQPGFLGRLEAELSSELGESECVEWGMSTRRGYGQMSIGSKRLATYRVAPVHKLVRECVDGEVNSALTLHKCGNKACFNPYHTYSGTSRDNWNDVVLLGESRQIGETATNAKLTAIQVEEIRSRYIPTVGNRRGNGAELDKEFGLAKSGAAAIARGATWRY